MNRSIEEEYSCIHYDVGSSVFACYLQLQQLLKVLNPLFCSFSLPTTQFHTAGWGQRPGSLHRCTLGQVSGEALL